MHITIIIDVFRAFSTACYIIEQHPKQYILSDKTHVIEKLPHLSDELILIGKPEIGVDLKYHIPNSPTRVKQLNLYNKIVFHRTQAGAYGVLNSGPSDIILAASFVNVGATVEYVKKFPKSSIAIKPMGYEGLNPCLEDDLCADYIDSLLMGKNLDIRPYVAQLKEESGRYFFDKDQLQYPESDFNYCLEIDKFNFAVQAEVMGDYAFLSKI